MTHHDRQPHFGPFRLVRPLEPCDIAERWVALHERDRSNHTLYRFGACRDNAERRRMVASLERASELCHPHLLRIELFSLCAAGRPWAVTPYAGNQEGLVTLGRLLEFKGGRMSPYEADRTLRQVLEGVEHAHGAGEYHGPVSAREILVDRHGSLLVELYGLRRAMLGLAGGNAELVRDEVRSVVSLGYQLVTGLPADEPRIRASRIVRRLDRAWDDWLDRGLDPTGGFDTATEALEALPSNRFEAEINVTVGRSGGQVRSVLGRLRRSIGTQD